MRDYAVYTYSTHILTHSTVCVYACIRQLSSCRVLLSAHDMLPSRLCVVQGSTLPPRRRGSCRVAVSACRMHPHGEQRGMVRSRKADGPTAFRTTPTEGEVSASTDTEGRGSGPACCRIRSVESAAFILAAQMRRECLQSVDDAMRVCGLAEWWRLLRKLACHRRDCPASCTVACISCERHLGCCAQCSTHRRIWGNQGMPYADQEPVWRIPVTIPIFK